MVRFALKQRAFRAAGPFYSVFIALPNISESITNGLEISSNLPLYLRISLRKTDFLAQSEFSMASNCAVYWPFGKTSPTTDFKIGRSTGLIDIRATRPHSTARTGRSAVWRGPGICHELNALYEKVQTFMCSNLYFD